MHIPEPCGAGARAVALVGSTGVGPAEKTPITNGGTGMNPLHRLVYRTESLGSILLENAHLTWMWS